MHKFLNKKQKEAVAGFCFNIAVAWFVGIFVVPKLTADFDFLTFFKYLVNMSGMFLAGILLLKEEKK
jgi:hypothetical protein